MKIRRHIIIIATLAIMMTIFCGIAFADTEEATTETTTETTTEITTEITTTVETEDTDVIDGISVDMMTTEAEGTEEVETAEEAVIPTEEPDTTEPATEVEETATAKSVKKLSAKTSTTQIKMNGTSECPYFEFENGTKAFCVEAEKTHPSDGCSYGASAFEVSDEDGIKAIFINASLENDAVYLPYCIQHAIWTKISGTDNSAILGLLYGPEAVDCYNRLMAAAPTGYDCSLSFWETEATDLSGAKYQKMVSATVTAKPVVTPEEPVVTPETPTVTPEEPVVTPETPTTTPEEPVITPETLSNEHVVEPTPEPTPEPKSETEVLSSDIPVTGDTTNMIIYFILLVAATIMLTILVVAKKRD